MRFIMLANGLLCIATKQIINIWTLINTAMAMCNALNMIKQLINETNTVLYSKIVTSRQCECKLI